MKKLLCLILPLFALCTSFKVPSSNQQINNEWKNDWCGGYLTIENSVFINDPKIRKVTVSDLYITWINYYSVPSGSSSYDVPETLHTGERYRLTFNVRVESSGFPGSPGSPEEWTLEMKRPDGIVVKKVLFETEGAGNEDVLVLFTPECFTYEVSVRPRMFFD